MSDDQRGRSAPPGVGPDFTFDGTSEDASTTPSPKMLPTGLLPLKTRAESRALTETVDVYIIELPARSANNVLKCVASCFHPL